jgi:hypothetical protein
VECFLLKPKEEATKGTKKKQSKLKNLHRRSGSENFLTKTEMDSRYSFFQIKRVQQLQRISGLREETELDEAFMAAAVV